MYKKFLYSIIHETDFHGRIITCGFIILFISYGILSFQIQIIQCHRSIFSLSKAKTIGNISLLQCNISYDECRCSATSNKFNNSKNCITNIQAMSGHILPPLSFVLQIYIIYKLFSLTGNLSRIQTNLFWFAALLVFMITAVTAQGNSCLHFYTSEIALYSDFLLFLVVYYLVIHATWEYPSHTRYKTYRKRRLVKKNHNRQMLTIVIVS